MNGTESKSHRRNGRSAAPPAGTQQIQYAPTLIRACEDFARETLALLEDLRCLRAEEAAKLLGMSIASFHRLKLPRIKLGDSKNAMAVYRLSTLRQLLREREAGGESPNRPTRQK